jgi:alkylated DNA repair dioxygenase AlkB
MPHSEDLSPEEGCHLVLLKNWLTATEATALEQGLLDGQNWEERAIVMFGRKVLQPRLVAWAGERSYQYSGQTLRPRQFSPELQAIQDRIASYTGHQFNHVLINRYRDGQDSIGWHSDNERSLGKIPYIASLSLGAPRHFLVRPKTTNIQSPNLDLLLDHGDLLLMGGNLQQLYQHSIPKQPGLKTARINLTFRTVL